MELFRLTIAEALHFLKTGVISAPDLLTAVFQRIDAVEDRVRAYVTLTQEKAITMAEEAQQEKYAGVPGRMLTGIPLAVKDNKER